MPVFRHLTLGLIGLLFLSTAAWAQKPRRENRAPRAPRAPLLSPFASTVRGIPIRNTHIVAESEGKVLRGMAPLSAADVSSLTDFGINEVLIFRNDVPGETGIADELRLLSANPKIRAVHLIPFKWKDITDFRGACQDTIKGLQLLRAAVSTGGSGLFFHCTVGEDRTGYLAGLYRILFEGAAEPEVFRSEMCARGYADGDPNKPAQVTEAVHGNVTVLYLKMLSLIESGALRADHMDLSVCERDPGESRRFQAALAAELEKHRCPPAPREALVR